MILEGIITTLDANGAVNVAPMGPIVDEDESPEFATLLLRPFQTSQTFANLVATRCGVLHVVDDVLLIAQAVVHGLEEPKMVPARVVTGNVIADACRWFEFEVGAIDDRQERSEITARVVHRGTIRPHFGFNRAKHAVLELAILATRVHLLPGADVLAQIENLRPLVEKTAGNRERKAFALVEDHIQAHYSEGTPTPSQASTE